MSSPSPAGGPGHPGVHRSSPHRRRHLARLAPLGVLLALLLPVAGLAAADVLPGRRPTQAERPRELARPVTTSSATVPATSSARPSRPAITTSASSAASSRSGVGTRSTRLESLARVRSAPVRLRISSLDVDAPVRPVGLRAGGADLALPDSATDLGWWAYGAAPRESSGTTLIAGHVAWDRHEGALWRLSSLRTGSRVTLSLSDGGTRDYRVVERREVRKTALAGLGLFTATGDPRLVVVTCGGRYDPAAHAWEDNVVVEAVPAG